MTTITNKSSSFLVEGREISEEFLESEKPALEQLIAMGYEYKNQTELNKERTHVKFYSMIDLKMQLEN